MVAVVGGGVGGWDGMGGYIRITVSVSGICPDDLFRFHVIFVELLKKKKSCLTLEHEDIAGDGEQLVQSS